MDKTKSTLATWLLVYASVTQMKDPQDKSRRQRSWSRTILCLLVPHALYFVTLFSLLLTFGGHHSVFWGTNPFCRHVSDDIVHPSLSNTSAPPRVIIHISDLHVTDIDGGKVKRRLKAFEDRVIPQWAPLSHAIIVSGDLVNAIERWAYPFGAHSVQYESEWTWLDSYATRINQSVTWVSTHGNHDSFGGRLHQHSHLPRLSPLACSTHPLGADKSQQQTIFPYHFSNGSLILISVDATLSRPLHRPLNFFGDASDASTELDRALQDLEDNSDMPSRDILVFGHYPSSVMRAGKRIHSIAQYPSPSSSAHAQFRKPRFSAYLSGHLHSLYGLAPYGLQAVSKSGVLELENADMAYNGAYRILAFDSGYLSYHTFGLKPRNVSSTQFLNEIIVLNPPRAGLCSAGAGSAAINSTHIRLLSPLADLQAKEVHVRIDDVVIGDLSRFDQPCAALDDGPDRKACEHVYGVEWNASLFEYGVHNLSFHTKDGRSEGYPFALDGTFETTLNAQKTNLVSAMFGLSDFETIAPILSNVALLFAVVFCIPGAVKRSFPASILMLFSIAFGLGAPLLIANTLRAVDNSYGWVGLTYTSLSSTVANSGIDAPFILSREVVWSILVPASWTQFVIHYDLLDHMRFPRAIFMLVVYYLWRCFSWCLQVTGAYGVSAALASPSCLLLYGVCLWSSFRVRLKSE